MPIKTDPALLPAVNAFFGPSTKVTDIRVTSYEGDGWLMATVVIDGKMADATLLVEQYRDALDVLEFDFDPACAPTV